MQLYAIRRRHAAATPEDLESADARSRAVREGRPDEVQHVRTYLLDEGPDGFGTVCFYLGVDEDAIRRHAADAGIPADEVTPVLAIDVGQEDPVLTA